MTTAFAGCHLDGIKRRSEAAALEGGHGVRNGFGHAPGQAVKARCDRRIVVNLGHRGHPKGRRVARFCIDRHALVHGSAHHVDARADLLSVRGQSLPTLHLAPRIGDGVPDQHRDQALEVRNAAVEVERFNRFNEFHGEVSCKGWIDEAPFVQVRLHQSIRGNLPTRQRRRPLAGLTTLRGFRRDRSPLGSGAFEPDQVVNASNSVNTFDAIGTASAHGNLLQINNLQSRLARFNLTELCVERDLEITFRDSTRECQC